MSTDTRPIYRSRDTQNIHDPNFFHLQYYNFAASVTGSSKMLKLNLKSVAKIKVTCEMIGDKNLQIDLTLKLANMTKSESLVQRQQHSLHSHSNAMVRCTSYVPFDNLDLKRRTGNIQRWNAKREEAGFVQTRSHFVVVSTTANNLGYSKDNEFYEFSKIGESRRNMHIKFIFLLFSDLAFIVLYSYSKPVTKWWPQVLLNDK